MYLYFYGMYTHGYRGAVLVCVFTPPSILVHRLSSLTHYYVPKDGPLSSYKDYIEQLPAMDRPEAFGQHPNADIASQIRETRCVCCVRACMHAYIRVCMHAYVRACVRVCVCVCARACVYVYTDVITSSH